MNQELNQLSEPEQNILNTCILLEQFRFITIAQIWQGEVDAKAVRALLNHKLLAYLEPLAEDPEMYRVKAPVAATFLKQWQAQQNAAYVQLLMRIVGHLASQLVKANDDEERVLAEASLMRCFDRLFFSLADGNDLMQLNAQLALLDALPIEQMAHRQSLRYYHAVVLRDEAQFAQAEDALQTLLGDDSLQLLLRARALNALGLLYDVTGRFDLAMETYARSADAYQTLGDDVGFGKVLKNQGIVYHELAQYDKALPLFKRVYALGQRAGDLELQERALLELGYTLKELGQWNEAESYYAQGLVISQQREDLDMIARFFNNLGEICYCTGQWSKANQYYEKSLEIMVSPQRLDKREAADILHNLGLLAFIKRQFNNAQDNFERALTFAQEIQDDAAISEIYHRLGDLWMHQRKPEQAYLFYKQAIDVLESMFGQVAAETTRIGLMGTRQHLYQGMVLCCLELERPHEALTYVQRAKSRAFLDLLVQDANVDAEYVEHPYRADEIQAALPANQVIVEYFGAGHTGASEHMLANLPQEAQIIRDFLAPPHKLWAFVITSQNLHVIQLKADLRKIERQCFYRQNGRLRGTLLTPGKPLSDLPWWQLLARQLVEPLRPLLATNEHIYLAPYGILHLLPLHALSLHGQIAEIAEPTMSYIPSASSWLHLSKPAQTRNGLTENVLTIGVNQGHLSHAEAEAAWIAQKLDGRALLGAAATVNRVCTELPQARIIHFSGHGQFHSSKPMSSALALADGELTADLILRTLKLQAEIVTLSACDTALNHLAYGDELMGLARAFLGAGAQALVMALWQVHEIPTRFFMEHFYAQWQMGLGRTEALRSAQNHVRTLHIDALRSRLARSDLSTNQLNQQIDQFAQMNPGKFPFNHPYYWSAFCLIGNPH
ncbi:MAG: CHAT domain-containing tetratricopeptide repeat protein [Caldilineaceae bacterium]